MAVATFFLCPQSEHPCAELAAVSAAKLQKDLSVRIYRSGDICSILVQSHLSDLEVLSDPVKLSVPNFPYT